MQISLYEFQHIVKEALQTCFPDSYWITAEISDMRLAGNGHCYLELLDKNEHTHDIIAKAKAMIWNRSYPPIAQKFEKATGDQLKSGQRVLVQINVALHELYGYSFTISDIDPTYTVGEIVRRRKEIINRLDQEGLLRRNAQHTLPAVPRRIAIISSETAAGYEDLLNQLQQSPYTFYPTLFAALMQGNGVDESILKALRKIEPLAHQFDAVVIIRGGGASSDLNCFDSYIIAREIALFPLPVIVGIGHERDETVLDFVSHTRAKTPTAAAELLIGRIAQTERKLEQLEQTIVLTIKQLLSKEQSKCEHNVYKLNSIIQQRLNQSKNHFDQKLQLLSFASSKIMINERHRLERLEQTLKLLSPDELLRKGYSMATYNGKLITSSLQLQIGDTITSYFMDGKIESNVSKQEIYN